MTSRTRTQGQTARFALATGIALAIWGATPAQVTPAAGSTPADDTPSVKVGGVIFADYTYQSEPSASNDAGTYNPNAFNLTRGYINVTGSISHLFSYRVTPDIKQETKATGTDLTGNYVFRLKYAYGQLNLDDWLSKGSWVRLGMQQTPYVDYTESIYRYRFQGKIMPDREKFLSSSDAGLSARLAFPGNYGDVHVGYYNGENYEAPELNDQKAIEVRATVRPAPMAPVVKGLRITGFYVADKPISGGQRDRMLATATFEHERVNAAFEYIDVSDKASSTATENKPKGWSAWVTPKLGKGFEALLRYDDVEHPDQGADAFEKHTIVGVGYWPAVQKGVQMSVLLDYDDAKYEEYTTPKAEEKRYALHTLFQF
jgi:hypothetical protein